MGEHAICLIIGAWAILFVVSASYHLGLSNGFKEARRIAREVFGHDQRLQNDD